MSLSSQVREILSRTNPITDDERKIFENRLREYHYRMLVLLDQVDYIRGNCGVNSMVGSVLDRELLESMRKFLEEG